MGKKNKVVKLTDRKIRYIIRAKKRGDSTKRIAEDMKLSQSSVKRVWMHWTKTKMPLNIKKFGRKKKTLDEESVKLILEVMLITSAGASTKSKHPQRAKFGRKTTGKYHRVHAWKAYPA